MTEPTHPRWPDGDLVELGDLCRRDDHPTDQVWRVVTLHLGRDGHHYLSADIVSGPVPANARFANSKLDRVIRVLPPRPVAGEMPEGLARWLEDSRIVGLAGDVAQMPRPSRDRLTELFDWARTLLVVDAEIVDDDSPRCDATRPEPGAYSYTLTCNRPAGHAGRLQVADAAVASDAGHYDPERGWW